MMLLGKKQWESLDEFAQELHDFAADLDTEIYRPIPRGIGGAR